MRIVREMDILPTPSERAIIFYYLCYMSTKFTQRNIAAGNNDVITRQRKKEARSIRPTERKNANGTVSTHVMESGEGEGKFKHQVNPTIFPNKDGSWTDLGGKGLEAYKEAQKRGEVFGFKSQKKAEKFAHGSWKKGEDRREAMKSYRSDKRNKI